MRTEGPPKLFSQTGILPGAADSPAAANRWPSTRRRRGRRTGSPSRSPGPWRGAGRSPGGQTLLERGGGPGAGGGRPGGDHPGSPGRLRKVGPTQLLVCRRGSGVPSPGTPREHSCPGARRGPGKVGRKGCVPPPHGPSSRAHSPPARARSGNPPLEIREIPQWQGGCTPPGHRPRAWISLKNLRGRGSGCVEGSARPLRMGRPSWRA
jgi:hypothetical protein